MSLRTNTRKKLVKSFFWLASFILFFIGLNSDFRLVSKGQTWNSEQTVWFLQLNHRPTTVDAAERFYTEPVLNRLKSVDGVVSSYGLTYAHASVFLLLSNEHRQTSLQHARNIVEEVVANQGRIAGGSAYHLIVRPLKQVEQELSLGYKSFANADSRLWAVTKAILQRTHKQKTSTFHISDVVEPDIEVTLGKHPLSNAALRTAKTIMQLDGVLDVFFKNVHLPTIDVKIDSIVASRTGLLAADIITKMQSRLQKPFSSTIENAHENLLSARNTPTNVIELGALPLHFFEKSEIKLSDVASLEQKISHQSLFFPDEPHLLTKLNENTPNEDTRLSVVLAPQAEPNEVRSKIKSILEQNLSYMPFRMHSRDGRPGWQWIGLVGIFLCILSLRAKQHVGILQHIGLSLLLCAVGGLLLNLPFDFLTAFLILIAFIFSSLSQMFEKLSDKKNLPSGILGRHSSGKLLFLFAGSMWLTHWLFSVSVLELYRTAQFSVITLALWAAESLAFSPYTAKDDSLPLNKSDERNRFVKFCFVLMCLFCVAKITQPIVSPRSDSLRIAFKNTSDAVDLANSAEVNASGSVRAAHVFGHTTERQLVFVPNKNGNAPGNETLLARATAAIGPQSIGWLDVNSTPTLIQTSELAFSNISTVDEAFSKAHAWTTQVSLGHVANAVLQSFPNIRLKDNAGYKAIVEFELNKNQSNQNVSLPANAEMRSDATTSRFVKSEFGTWLLLFSFICFLLSGLLFNSLGRGLRILATLYLTFGLGYALSSIISLNAKVSLLSEHLQFEWSFYFAVLLTALWNSVAVTSESRRLQGMHVSNSLDFCKRRFESVSTKSFILCTGSCILSFTDNRFFYLVLPTFALGVFLRWMALGWFMMWIQLTEQFYRYTLRWSIGFVKNAAMLLVAGIVGYGQQSFLNAAENVHSISANCTNIVTVVFPIYGRPKGVESPVAKSVYTERLAQEIPCSYIELGKTTELLELHTSSRDTRSQGVILNKIEKFLEAQNENLGSNIRQHFPVFTKAQMPRIRVLGGYFEEFFGATAFTIVDIQNGILNSVTKEWYASGEDISGIATLAKQLKNDDSLFIEKIIQKHERVPVFLRTVESLDKHPISENLSEEVEVFVRSRLQFPTKGFVFDRKAFFTEINDIDKAKYIVDINIRRDGVRMFASGTIEAKSGRARRTFWIEGDLSNIHHFTDTVFETIESELAALDGIFNYVAVIGGEFWAQNEHPSKFLTAQFRQNRGNASFSFRIRNGELDSADKPMRTLTLGALAGWQFIDLRWAAADVGLSVDLGSFGETFKKLFFERSFIASYGGYAQTQFIVYENISIIVRAGLEKPMQISVNEKTTKLLLPTLSQSLMIGAGVAF